jgi:hypothetical protein
MVNSYSQKIWFPLVIQEVIFSRNKIILYLFNIYLLLEGSLAGFIIGFLIVGLLVGLVGGIFLILRRNVSLPGPLSVFNPTFNKSNA